MSDEELKKLKDIISAGLFGVQGSNVPVLLATENLTKQILAFFDVKVKDGTKKDGAKKQK
jgi:hypothetical protein